MEKEKINAIVDEPNEEKTWNSIYNTLYNINVDDLLKTKNNLKYLPWASAWSILLQHYPKSEYRIHEFPNENGYNLPFLDLGNLGAMVQTSVTIEGFTRTMWLPIMDASNKAMKTTSYEYEVKDKKGNIYIKTVKPYTIMDINKSTLRCLVKNLAMFGLGLYIYEGDAEDLPDDISQEEQSKIGSDKKGAKAKTVTEQSEQSSKPMVAKATPNQINYLKKLFAGNDQLLQGYIEQLKCKSMEELTQPMASQLIDIGKKLQAQKKES